jgi:hypothetical protein
VCKPGACCPRSIAVTWAIELPSKNITRVEGNQKR